MHIINLLLFWVFFGTLSSYIARKKGRNPKLWFAVGLLTGIFGVALAFFLPISKPKPHKQAFYSKASTSEAIEIPKPSSPSEFLVSNASLTPWFYLDESRAQWGPFDNLLQLWQTQKIHENSYVWTEGLPAWKRLKELPEFQSHLRQKKESL